jgi:hypothetical protein
MLVFLYMNICIYKLTREFPIIFFIQSVSNKLLQNCWKLFMDKCGFLTSLFICLFSLNSFQSFWFFFTKFSWIQFMNYKILIWFIFIAIEGKIEHSKSGCIINFHNNHTEKLWTYTWNLMNVPNECFM